MKQIRLNIQDRAFKKVITFLKNLPADEIEIIGDTEKTAIPAFKKFKAASIKTRNFKFDREDANAR